MIKLFNNFGFFSVDLVGFLNYMEEIGLFNHPDDSFKVKEWKAKVQKFDGDYNEEFELKKDLINTFGPRLFDEGWPNFEHVEDAFYQDNY